MQVRWRERGKCDMTTLEYILAGIAVGLAQALIVMVSRRGGYDAGVRDVRKRIAAWGNRTRGEE